MIVAGKNMGISGSLISMLKDGQGSPLPFNLRVLSHTGAINYAPIVRTGRGAVETGPMVRLNADPTGEGLINFKFQFTGYPLPDKPQFASGTIIHAMQTDGNGTPLCKVQIPALFKNVSWNPPQLADPQNPGAPDDWNGSANWELAGLPVWTWKGRQITITMPAYNQQETYEELAKTRDPYDLATDCVQRFDVQSVVDSDSAEADLLVSFIAAAVMPQAAQKLRTASWTRTDSNGGVVKLLWSKKTTKDDAELPERWVRVDPQKIADAASDAILDGIPAVPGGFELYTTTTKNLTTDHQLNVADFRLLNTAEEIQVRETNSWRSAMSSFIDKVALVINSTDTDSNESTNQWEGASTAVFPAGFQAQSYAMGLSLRSLNKGRKVVIFEYMNPGIQLQGLAYGGSRMVPAVNNGGTLQVYLDQVKKCGTSGGVAQYYCHHSSVPIRSVPIQRFMIMRFLQGTVVPRYPAQLGTTNNSSFLGLDAGTVVYNNAQFTTNLSLSSILPFFMAYDFEADGNMIFDYQGVRDDWFWFTGSSAPVVGFNNASIFSAGQIVVNTLAQSDFSVFIT